MVRVQRGQVGEGLGVMVSRWSSSKDCMGDMAIESSTGATGTNICQLLEKLKSD